METQIHDAVLSVGASTSGNTATLVEKLIDCLDYVAVPQTTNVTASQECLSRPDGAVQLTARRITDGYIQQLVRLAVSSGGRPQCRRRAQYGYLPPNLILDLQQQILPTLDNATPEDAARVKQQLDDLFTASGQGPQYVTCYQCVRYLGQSEL
jgi:hypothetical protein